MTVLLCLLAVLAGTACGGGGRGAWLPGEVSDPSGDAAALEDSPEADGSPGPWDTATDLAVDVVPELPLDTPPDLPPPPDWPTLVLDGVVPPTGGFQGGDNVTLTGDGFVDGALEVDLDGVPALGIIVITPKFANIVIPPHPPGLVDVRVSRKDGQEAVLEDGFLYDAALDLFDVEPASGPAEGGTALVVTGQGFDAGVRLLVGGRLATDLQVLDPFTLSALTPPGSPGPQDLLLLKEGAVETLEDAFTYEGAPHPAALAPGFGPETGGTTVLVSGSGFSETDTVWFGDLPAGDTVLLNPLLLRARTPPGWGTVDVRVQGPFGEGLVPAAFAYLPELPEPPEAPLILSVVPGTGPAAGGAVVTVLTAGFGEDPGLAVSFGGIEATVIDIPAEGVLSVVTPAGAPGPVDVAVSGTAGNALLPDGYLYQGGLALTAATPVTGPAGGGTTVTVTGQGFSEGLTLRFGAAAAASVTLVSDQELLAVSPPGSPGPVDLIADLGGQTAVLPAAFSWVTATPELYAIDPPVAARSGGTLLRVLGAGFPAGAEVHIGDVPLLDPQAVSPSLLVGRAPPGKPGTYDVRLLWDGGELLLPAAFTYYDPINKKGGTWGGPVDDALNLTVLDGSTGAAIPGAAVILEKDGEPDRTGFTDENGQITFSDFGLQGKHRITAAAIGYTLYSVVHFDATNVTVYLVPLVQSSGGGGTYTVVKQYIAGRVFGQDKYLVVPPGSCANKVPAGAQCLPCETDADCLLPAPESGAACVDIADTGTWCALPCGTEELPPCEVGYVCAEVADENYRCIPAPGPKVVRCYPSSSSLYAYLSIPGPGYEVNDHGIYFIESRAGEVAVVCFGGYTDYDTGVFKPVVLGIARNVIVLKGEVVKDVDVHLSIPLGATADIGFWDLPQHPVGIRTPYIILSLKLGKDGYIAPPTTPVWDAEAELFHVEDLPLAYTGPLYGSSWNAYVSINANTLMGMPYAVRLETDIPTLMGDGLLRLEGDTVSLHQGPQVRRIRALLEDGDDALLLAAEDGLWRFDGGWTPQPVPEAARGILALHRDPVTGDVWAAGGEGTLWHHHAGGWQVLETGIDQALNDVWTEGSRVVAAGDLGALAVSADGGESFTASTWPSIPDLHGVWGIPGGPLRAVGDDGVILRWDGDAWEQEWSLGDGTLRDIDGEGSSAFWVAGDQGALYFFNGTDWLLLDTGVFGSLQALRSLGGGRLLAAGTDGALLSLEDWVAVTALATGTRQDLLAVAPGGPGVIWAGGIASFDIGPFHPFPVITNPQADAVFDWQELAWDYAGQGTLSPTWHSLSLTTLEGYPFWQLVTDGVVRTVPLPSFTGLLGVNLIPQGDKRLTVTGAASPGFDIDNFRNVDMGTGDRESWAIDMVLFK